MKKLKQMLKWLEQRLFKSLPQKYLLDEYPQLAFYLGTHMQWRRTGVGVEGVDQEKILMSACCFHYTWIACVSRPGRHHHLFSVREFAGLNTRHDVDIQGFMTSYGRFVNRIEGWKIAEKAGQILPESLKARSGSASVRPELFSEDVWESDSRNWPAGWSPNQEEGPK